MPSNSSLSALCRLGHTTRHFNVGQYRRKQKGDDLQDAAFFDHNNTVSPYIGMRSFREAALYSIVRHALLQAGMKAREQALYAALDDMESWLATGTVRQAGRISKYNAPRGHN